MLCSTRLKEDTSWKKNIVMKNAQKDYFQNVFKMYTFQNMFCACFTCSVGCARRAAAACSAAVCVWVCVRPCAAASEESCSCSRSTVTGVCNSQTSGALTQAHGADPRGETPTHSLRSSDTSETWTHTHTRQKISKTLLSICVESNIIITIIISHCYS